jgi:hypothetical protein
MAQHLRSLALLIHVEDGGQPGRLGKAELLP